MKKLEKYKIAPQAKFVKFKVKHFLEIPTICHDKAVPPLLDCLKSSSLPWMCPHPGSWSLAVAPLPGWWHKNPRGGGHYDIYGKSVARTFLGTFFWAPVPFKRTKIHLDAALKKAKVQPLYKKDGKTEKSNYRPIRVLSNVSKIYERCLHDQIYSYFDKIFSVYQWGFVKY